uniref:DEP domain-containing protein n=1 Tax=Davidia involucrata TaxID=16924 RepID=A0A5B6YP86_DAVIN
MEKEDSTETNTISSPTAEKREGDTPDVQKKDLEKEDSSDKNSVKIPTAENEEGMPDVQKEDQEMENSTGKNMVNSPAAGKEERGTRDFQKDDQEKVDCSQKSELNSTTAEKLKGDKLDDQKEDQEKSPRQTQSSNINEEAPKIVNEKRLDDLNEKMGESRELESENEEGRIKKLEELLDEEEEEPVFDGTEVPGMEANRSASTRSLDLDPETQGSWPEKAVALTKFVREKCVIVSNVLRRLSGKSDDGQNVPDDEAKDDNIHNSVKEVSDSPRESEAQEASQKTVERSGWNPLSFIRISRDDAENKADQQEEVAEKSAQPIAMKGRIVLYTRLGCQDCKEARLFLHRKRLRYVEINIDVYPSRKLELEKIAGSSAVPRVFFNEVLIGGVSELKGLDESGKLNEKIEYVITEGPSYEAPLQPLSGEDDVSSTGAIDELAVIVRKMKESVVVKDRFYKIRRFTNAFLGSEAVDFLSEDQYLEREEAIEFGRKLASKLFFRHVLDENLFEDGNHLYRFLDHDPIVSQCHNISRGIIEVKPKPITEISSRLRFLSYAIFEAYTSEDGMHVDYRSIHGSEEFARYLRIVEELQRIELQDMPREEKLAFFINLYNMMTIHAILVWGHPAGALERRKLLGDFKYVIGGCTYSLSAIQNGILRGNQRPPYNLIKPFGMKDKRFKVALPYPEPLIHFALVCGNRSGPALQCYSPGNIDKELMEAARNFLRSGGLVVDLNAKVASVSMIFKWFSVDFGKNEVEVLKHAANYLEPADSEALLELLATTQLKVVYQPYDWGLNY